MLLGASDIVEQLLVERRSWSAFDPGVIVAVVVYGVIYNGPMNVIIYRLYEKTYREETMGRAQAVLAKVATDQLVSSPFVYTPGTLNQLFHNHQGIFWANFPGNSDDKRLQNGAGYYIVTGLVRLHSPSEIWTTLRDAWFPSVQASCAFIYP